MKNVFHRILAVLIISVLCVNAFGAVSVNATDTVTSILFGEVYARPDSLVSVPIVIANNTGIASFRFRVTYDAQNLEFVSAEKGEKFSGGTMACTTNAQEQTVTFLWYSVTDVVADGEMVVLNFKTSDNASGEYLLDVTYKQDDILNQNRNPINHTVTNGIITVVESIKGDTTEDNIINNKDLGMLMQYINGWDVEMDIDAADVNGDGALNNKDYAVLIRYINGWDVELK